MITAAYVGPNLVEPFPIGSTPPDGRATSRLAERERQLSTQADEEGCSEVAAALKVEVWRQLGVLRE